MAGSPEQLPSNDRELVAADFYRALIDAAPDAVVVVDQRGIIVLANRRCVALLGWAQADLVGRPLEVLVPPELRDLHVKDRAAYSAKPRTRPMAMGRALSALRADGTQVPVDISLSPIEAPGATVVMAAIRDASARRRMEEDLQASELRWKTSLATMLDAFALLRCVRVEGKVVDFAYVYLNAAAAATFGRPAGDLIGARVSDTLPGFLTSRRFRDYLQVVETGEPLTSLQ